MYFDDYDFYVYRALVVDVYDGDTVTLKVDLGFNVSTKVKARLHGIDAPEVRGEERPEGLKARDFLRDMILNKEVTIRTHRDKQGKYGRWLVEIFADELNICKELVDNGYASIYPAKS